ncbi:MAG: hypothetical protein Q8O95_03455 [bacterium]|nr:hypothetical protein [bacterium]
MSFFTGFKYNPFMRSKLRLFIIGLLGLALVVETAKGQDDFLQSSFADDYPCFHEDLAVGLSDLDESNGNVVIKNQLTKEISDIPERVSRSVAFFVKLDNRDVIDEIENWYKTDFSAEPNKPNYTNTIDFHKSIIKKNGLREISASISNTDLIYGISKQEFAKLLDSGDYCLISDFENADYHSEDIGSMLIFPIDFNEIKDDEKEPAKENNGTADETHTDSNKETSLIDEAARFLWKKAAPYFTSGKYSQVFLFHSLQDDPEPLTFTDGDELVDLILESEEYKKYISDIMYKADRLKVTEVTDDQANKNSIKFSKNDLSTTIGGTKLTKIEGLKNLDGSWKITTTISDRYDFEYKFREYSEVNNSDSSSLIKTIANNMAASDQRFGVIRPYWITIQFTHIYPMQNEQQ